MDQADQCDENEGEDVHGKVPVDGMLPRIHNHVMFVKKPLVAHVTHG